MFLLTYFLTWRIIRIDMKVDHVLTDVNVGPLLRHLTEQSLYVSSLPRVTPRLHTTRNLWISFKICSAVFEMFNLYYIGLSSSTTREKLENKEREIVRFKF